MKIDFVKQGKRNKAAGARFEKKVRLDLESKGFICSKWQNNVEILKYDNQEGNFSGEIKCVPAKPGRFRMMQTGFPDFIAFQSLKSISNFCEKKINKEDIENLKEKGITKSLKEFGVRIEKIFELSKEIPNCFSYEIIFVECKTNGYLSKLEKEKAKWYLENNYCGKFLIAKKIKVGRKVEVEYKEFK